ncbi:hypothetical protein [Erwinia rhapontici]|uniref:hypothetical protein n=1 Tax=Erwinia rhapontici TaxID=55212 RepID=UPI001331283D|nr:hypothetical protein [Erwinia rhapontici]MBP2156882.1 hypothetical protein [Erwinia rhapontici]
MKTFQELLEERRKAAVRRMFTPKTKCCICMGTGLVSIWATINSEGTAEVNKALARDVAARGSS